MKSKTFILTILCMATVVTSWELPDFLGDGDAAQVETANAASHLDLQESRDLQTKPKLEATMSPTESPAPSPSPSSSPTESPTTTSKPTAKVTEAPTESPAPSPSPSSSPTEAPTQAPTTPPSMQPTTTRFPTTLPSAHPSHSPTDQPSALPTMAPTRSAMPSVTPTSAPSNLPSVSPTRSAKPSTAPSAAPTTSVQPSAAPSYIGKKASSFAVQLDLTAKLTQDEVKAFEEGTEAFLNSCKMDDGDLSDSVVEVNGQDVIQVEIPVSRRKAAEATKPGPTESKLLLNFTASTVYTGKDNDFNLHKYLQPKFDDLNQLWIRSISERSAVFQPMQQVIPGLEGETYSQKSPGLAKAGVVGVVFVALGAIALGIAASVYSIRTHNKAAFEEEIPNPTPSPSNMFSTQALDGGEVQPSKSYGTVAREQMSDGMATAALDGAYVCSPFMGPKSPNSLEKGQISKSVADSSAGRPPYCMTYNIPCRNGPDPPTTNSGNYGHARDPRQTSLFDTMDGTTSEFSEVPFPQASGSINAIGIHSAKYRNKIAQRVDHGSLSGYSEMNHELKLSQSKGGTLGAVAVDESNAGASDFGSQAMSFFANFMGRNEQKLNQMEQNSPKIRPNKQEERRQPVERTPYESITRRAGLYDVFAPAGPIGIVVDTTKDGPTVHSLKTTSPMLGLINPGDLIVGLDDEDTRGMTAATLTRLMAKKANQKERKITLLTAEAF